MRASLCLVVFCGCTTAVTWHGEVKPLVDGRCVACHGEGATLDLRQLAAAKSAGPAIVDAVVKRRMPPRFGAHGDIASVAPALTEPQRLLFQRWAEGGFREGDASKPGAPLADPFTCNVCLLPPAPTPELGRPL